VAKASVSVAPVAQQLLIVLLLGAGTDYGLFLVFRMREELRRGTAPRQALVAAMGRVGEAITYSGLTVAAALLTLLLAPFAIYRGLGPALAIGIGVLLAASLTLTPALLAILGRAVFWPSHPRPGTQKAPLWGRLAERVVRRPVLTLVAGVVVFGALAAGLTGYRTSGLTSGAPSGSDSAAGAAVLAAHFPRASVGADQLLLRFAAPVWDDPAVLTTAQAQLAGDAAFQSVAGPLGPGRGSLSAARLAGLHQTLGPAAALPAVETRQASSSVPPALYQAYRAVHQPRRADRPVLHRPARRRGRQHRRRRRDPVRRSRPGRGRPRDRGPGVRGRRAGRQRPRHRRRLERLAAAGGPRRAGADPRPARPAAA
jgi:RND superfamily putative drug exporter